MKKCNKCKFEKEEKSFSKNQKACKECYKNYYDSKCKKICVECKNICSGKRHKYCSNECKIIHNTIKCENGCWEWKGKNTESGYFATKDIDEVGKNIQVHRLSYRIFKGNIPEGKLVCHACDNRRCCNPKHLWIGTHHDNNQDCLKKGRNSGGQGAGELNPSAKLNEKDVKKIRSDLKDGIRPYILAKKYKVESSCILAIRDFKTWRHILQE